MFSLSLCFSISVIFTVYLLSEMSVGLHTIGLKWQTISQTSNPPHSVRMRVKTLSKIRCAQICLRLSDNVCDSITYYIADESDSRELSRPTCEINNPTNQSDEASVALDYSNSKSYKITGQYGVLWYVEKNVNYSQAMDACLQILGTLAFYEQLISAASYGVQMSCKPGWLVSGELAFTEAEGGCYLPGTEFRCNAYPYLNTSFEGAYCYIGANPSVDEVDYHSPNRIIRLYGSDHIDGFTYKQAEERCTKDFDGRLITTSEAFNLTFIGINTCFKSWFLVGLVAKPMPLTSKNNCWNPTVLGNRIYLTDITQGRQTPYAICWMHNRVLSADPFPSHRVVIIKGDDLTSLTYANATALCSETVANGDLATYDQVEYAQLIGFNDCDYGWLKNGSLAFAVGQVPGPNATCNGAREKGVYLTAPLSLDEKYTGLCYLP
ncbi:uncharacterized protein LOC117120252 [Anneissia japonica]|uniref:uncharacterized protein LOC117120252 n=1 Tax=Anneissia japonica TaxID=1529436 RepID=UPI001425B0E9|nr:uncharacterized protein LOC117120252 [Anneissia japonica]